MSQTQVDATALLCRLLERDKPEINGQALVADHAHAATHLLRERLLVLGRALLRPSVGRYGLCDYEKVFCADAKQGPDIFDARGIDRAAGCMVVVRPDQYVGHILPLSARKELAAYFAGILRVRG